MMLAEGALTCRAILEILERAIHASRAEWLFLRELKVGTSKRNGSVQRLDAFALNCLPHTAMKRICYEIKTSRADFSPNSNSRSNAGSACAIPMSSLRYTGLHGADVRNPA